MCRYFWSMGLVCAALLTAGAQSKPVLFTVGSQPVLAEEFEHLYRKNHPQKQDYTEVKVNEYLDLLVNFKLKVSEARALGVDTSLKFVREFRQYKEELKRPYRNEPDLLDKLAREAYERLQTEIKAAHILINVRPDAPPSDTLAAYQKISELRAQALSGKDFGKLAREHSQDPTAQQNNGNLGYFTAMQMVYPFEQGAYTTKPGEISPIVRTRFGYHIIKVIERQKSQGEVEVSHILLRKGAATDAKVKNKIFEAYDQLRGGRSWEDVCKEFSEDANTKDAGGRLRPFGIGALASVPEFETRAFAMTEPGKFSDPFESGIGWHIIRLERKIPVPPYAELEASLKRRIGRDERFTLSQQALRARQRQQAGFVENAEVKKSFIALTDSSLVKGKWKYIDSPEQAQAEIFRLSNKSYVVKDVVKYILQNQAPSGQTASAYLDQLYNNFVNEQVEDIEEKTIVSQHPEFGFLLTEYREGMMLFEIMEREVWKKASDDSVGQHSYYQRHQTKYQAGDRLEARVLAATSKDVIDEMVQKVMKGDTLKTADLKKMKSVQGPRTFEKGENKAVDKISWTVGLQQTQVDDAYYLVEVLRLVPPGIKSFTEARASIISDYQNELEKAWLATLKTKYPVKINKKVRKSVVKSLTTAVPGKK